MKAITTHYSEQRIENMLNEYWELVVHPKPGPLQFKAVPFHFTMECGHLFWYWPSCPEVDAENYI